MPRPAKPYKHQGHYVTTKGGKYRRLCPIADGFDRAVEIMNTPAPVAPVGLPRLSDLVEKYLAHARTYYRKNGVETESVVAVKHALESFKTFIANPIAANITRAQLRDYRDSLITAGMKRTTINNRIRWILTAFAWMTEYDYLPESVLASLRILSPLRAGRSAAPDSVPVKPVPWPIVEACLPHLSPKLKAVVLLQWYTGMRPGEALALRSDEIEGDKVDLSKRHKTAHTGRRRIIRISSKSVELLAPFLENAVLTNAPCLFPGRKPRSVPYTRQGYQKAIRLAADRAGVARWHANQIRHAYATRIRAALGIEAAQLALGHASLRTTQIYAEQDAGLWVKIAGLGRGQQPPASFSLDDRPDT